MAAKGAALALGDVNGHLCYTLGYSHAFPSVQQEQADRMPIGRPGAGQIVFV